MIEAGQTDISAFEGKHLEPAQKKQLITQFLQSTEQQIYAALTDAEAHGALAELYEGQERPNAESKKFAGDARRAQTQLQNKARSMQIALSRLETRFKNELETEVPVGAAPNVSISGR